MDGSVFFDYFIFWSPRDTYLAITGLSVVRFSKFKGVSVVFLVCNMAKYISPGGQKMKQSKI